LNETHTNYMSTVLPAAGKSMERRTARDLILWGLIILLGESHGYRIVSTTHWHEYSTVKHVHEDGHTARVCGSCRIIVIPQHSKPNRDQVVKAIHLIVETEHKAHGWEKTKTETALPISKVTGHLVKKPVSRETEDYGSTLQ